MITVLGSKEREHLHVYSKSTTGVQIPRKAPHTSKKTELQSMEWSSDFLSWHVTGATFPQYTCPSLLSVAVTKNNTGAKSYLKRKGFIWLNCLVIVHHKGKSSNSRNEPGVRNWSRVPKGMLLVDLVPMNSSVFFFIYPRTTYPRTALPTVNWTLPYQSLIKKMFHNLPHRSMWWSHFLNSGTLFQMTLDYLKLIKS